MITRGAFGNLVNRYKAVLKKCRLINTFGSLAVASMLTLSTAGVAGAASIYQPTAGTYTFTGETLSYSNASGDSVQAGSVPGKGDSYHGNTTVIIGDESTKLIESNARGGLFSAQNGHIILNSENVVITSTDTSGSYSALWAQNNSVNADGIPEEDRASIVINAQNTTLTSGSSAIVAMSNGMVEINGNLTAQAPDAVLARGNAIININKAGTGTVQLDGNVNFNYSGPTSGTGVDADVNINLNNADSYWNGNTVVSWYYTDESDAPKPEELNVSNLTVNLANGATWNPTRVTSTDEPSEDTSGTRYVGLNNLNLDKGVINLNPDVDVEVDNMTGSGTVNLAADIKEGEHVGTLTAGTAKDAALDVNITGVTSDDITAEQAKEIMSNVGSEDEELKLTGNVAEGLVNGALNIGSDGSVSMGRNHVMESALEIASITSVSLDRILNNDVRKRMGDLRSVSGDSGVWMRWDGGRLKGDSGLTNDFNTVQIGADTLTGWDSVRVGLAASFTYGDGDHKRGSSEMEGVALAAYGVWMADNGMFADVIARLGNFDTDVKLAGYKGSINSTVASLSGEFGWRFNLDRFYVEPQLELAYTYVDGDKFSLGSARYDVDDTDSLIGRAGVSAGWKLPGDRGDIYARASVVQQFLGDAKISGANNGMLNVYELDGQDTWFEYGVGTNLRLTEKASVWADVERTEGAKIDEEWRGTVGLRYMF